MTKNEGVLVTGGAGFIGSHLIGRLLRKDWRVIVVDNFDPFYEPQIKKKNIETHLKNRNFKFFKKDIREPNDIAGIFEEENLEVVIHLAARPGVRVAGHRTCRES